MPRPFDRPLSPRVDRINSTIAGHELDLDSGAAAALNHAAPDLSDLGMQRNRSKADTRQAVNLPSVPPPPPPPPPTFFGQLIMFA